MDTAASTTTTSPPPPPLRRRSPPAIMEAAQAPPSRAALLLPFFAALFFSGAATSGLAHIADFDEAWQERAREARAEALKAYHADPDTVTNHINHKVHGATESNSTRRQTRGMRKFQGPCAATNPIDRCWRCRRNWAADRKRLARCALGFGRGAMGGARGRYYVVTDPSDGDLVNPRPGTLRHAVIQAEPLWIVFARDMIIRLSEELIVNSYKTLDGRGAHVHIAHGGGITIQFVHHVIIHGLHIHDIKAGNGGTIRDSPTHFGIRTQSDGDGISVFGSSNVWIDHVSMSNCMDGLIDVVQASTAITISNSHFTNHDHVMLFGASDSYSGDSIMQITVAFNHFGRGLVQRMPRCRWGFFHVLNNDYTHWLMYAIGGSQNPTIVSQGNRYIAPADNKAKEVTHRVTSWDPSWKNWRWTSDGDLMKNGAFFVRTGGAAATPANALSHKQMIKAKPGSFVTRLTRYSGAIPCTVNRPC